ncbi:MAG TPA: DinB family protein [Flavipsychrobacter sp.]|nr:DinB family protein [Flavipsychrobacter sp.]
MQSERLILSLIKQTNEITKQAEACKHLDIETLRWKPNAPSWNTLECFEHLNLYGRFYLPEMEKKIRNAKAVNDREFKSGVLGGYFAKSMLPKTKLNKMKTFKDKNPLDQRLDKSVIEEFLQQQTKLLTLLQQSRKVSLNKVRINTSISSLIKLKLGDTFQFFINHIIRHMQQIERLQNTMKKS